LEQALLTFRQVVDEDPTSSLGYTRLGGVQLLRQQYRAGVESFQRAIALDQQNSDAFVGMALAYLHLGDYGLARESLKQAQLRYPAKREEIERVMAWIDQRSTASTH
jgi:tetratricopeptide (TPR) repeat protein